MRQERTLPAGAIRALPEGTWYLEPGADALAAASAHATKAITARAVAKQTPRQGDCDIAA